MTLKDIRDILVLISGDKGLTFTFVSESFCNLLNEAQLKHFKRKLGLPEQYTPGMPISRQSYEIKIGRASCRERV